MASGIDSGTTAADERHTLISPVAIQQSYGYNSDPENNDGDDRYG